jgi:hypothetical protein
VAIAVRPDEVRVQRHRRGWKLRSEPPVAVPVSVGQTVATACMQALEQALPAATRRTFDARIVLSDHLVRYAIVPRACELRDDVEREAAARHAMAAVYGEIAGRWRVVLDASGAGDDALAAAVDEDVCAGLTEQLKAGGARRLQIEPLFSFAMNRAGHCVTARTGWVAVVEHGRVVLASLRKGELGALRSHRLRKGMRAELPMLLEQDSLLENADPQRTEVVVATDDDAPLPEDTPSFQFRSLRLDLTTSSGLGSAIA